MTLTCFVIRQVPVGSHQVEFLRVFLTIFSRIFLTSLYVPYLIYYHVQYYISSTATVSFVSMETWPRQSMYERSAFFFLQKIRFYVKGL